MNTHRSFTSTDRDDPLRRLRIPVPVIAVDFAGGMRVIHPLGNREPGSGDRSVAPQATSIDLRPD